MRVLFSDLDNTLIYSHRHKIKQPIVLAEMLKGKEQSFMTEKTYLFFKNQSMFNTVAVTTRTYEQYSRLENLTENINIKDAVVCNGAFLMHNGNEDKIWTEESLKISENERPYLFEILNYANEIVASDLIVEIMPFMFYIKSDETERIFSLINEKADKDHVSVLKDARKIYCIVKSINKGNAVKRYINRFKVDFSISAGDSEFDIPMLKETNICFCPKEIENFETKGQKIVCDGLFSDAVCDGLEEMRKEGKF